MEYQSILRNEDGERVMKPKYYIVFQSASKVSGQETLFTFESKNDFIWAPFCDKNGRPVHHYERLKDIKPGDIILHQTMQKIQAISVAVSNCYSQILPEGVSFQGIDESGLRVNCKYYLLSAPVLPQRHELAIQSYRLPKYNPYNVKWYANQGYLYPIHDKLAEVFIDDARNNNPELFKDMRFLNSEESEGF